MNNEISSGIIVVETSLIVIETAYIYILHGELRSVKLNFAQELKNMENRYTARLTTLEEENKHLQKQIDAIMKKLPN